PPEEDLSEGIGQCQQTEDPMYIDARFEVFPTPPETPPAALLAACIQSPENESQPRTMYQSNVSSKIANFVANPKEHSVWQAAFCAGMHGNAVAKVDGKVYDRAKIRRLLQNPKARIHRKELPPPPTRHNDLETHILGDLFEKAELDHLKSHSEIKLWTEIERSSISKKIQILDCIWVYVYKFDKRGRLVKCKARLFVRGDQQTRS